MKKLMKYSLCLLLSLCSLSIQAQGLSAFGDVLGWHASEQSEAVWASVITIGNNGDYRNFKASDMDFNGNVGFRGGFLYEPENGFWDTKLYWTHYSADAKSVYQPNPGTFVLPQFFSAFLSGTCLIDPAIPGNCFTGANANWNLHFNTIDLTASHEFDAIKTLKIRPSIGIKAASIDQSIASNWNTFFDTIATDKVKNNFHGVGPTIGLDGEWNFYKNFSLAANFQAALMWGNWDITDRFHSPPALFGLIPPENITSKADDGKLGTTMFDYFLGMQWHYQGRSNMTVRLGYEMQYWENQLRVLTFQQLPLHGDLTLQGATCGIYLEL